MTTAKKTAAKSFGGALAMVMLSAVVKSIAKKLSAKKGSSAEAAASTETKDLKPKEPETEKTSIEDEDSWFQQLKDLFKRI